MSEFRNAFGQTIFEHKYQNKEGGCGTWAGLADVLGGAVNLALWSKDFRGPLPSDPPNGQICGFPWFDRHAELEHPPEEVEIEADERSVTRGGDPVLAGQRIASQHGIGRGQGGAPGGRVVTEPGEGGERVQRDDEPQESRAWVHVPSPIQRLCGQI